MKLWTMGLAGLALTWVWAGSIPKAMAEDTETSWQEWSQQNPTYRQLLRQRGNAALLPPKLIAPQTPRSNRGRVASPATSRVVATNNIENANGYSANLQAFLRVIRHAEGTNGEDGYQIKFTSRRFYSFTDHPRQVMCSSFRQRRLCSTAAGAYQFLDTTWDHVANRIGATDFSPYWQDRAAVALLERAGVIPLIESGQIEAAIARTATIWASFPRYSGDAQGAYSQAVKPMGELVNVFYYYRNAYQGS
jgi:muramidase (phage lysozyme)